MRVSFWKMHGAGNDFILVDDSSQRFPLTDSAWMASVAARRTGVGCDGIILIQPSADADFCMRFINPDGHEADMCGNGLRCVCRLAHEQGLAGLSMTVATRAGMMRAECLSDGRVQAWFPPVRGVGEDGELEAGGFHIPYCLINTGVPHAVVRCDALSDVADPLAQLGALVRSHPRFAPDGTNVDFISADERRGTLSVRTYERGVEAETLACGTGVVAAAIVAARTGMVPPPVTVSTAGGDTMEVSFQLSGSDVTEIALTGPAEHVYQGSLEYRP